MLVIRLIRTGKKNQPFFRIVVTEKQNAPRGGRAVEIVGFVNPHTKEKEIKKDRINYWMSVGAQPSDRVRNLLISEKIIKGEKVSVHNHEIPEKKEEVKEETPAPVEEKKEEVAEEPKQEEAPAEKPSEEPKEEIKKEEKTEETPKEDKKEEVKEEEKKEK